MLFATWRFRKFYVDIYSSVIGQSLEIDELIFKIHRKIKLEVSLCYL
jgi:hypothetical protein